MARRVFLHVGTMKSGTSYLRSLWWRHRDELLERGLLLPGAGKGTHFFAAALVSGRDDAVERMGPQERSAWDQVLRGCAAAPDDALVAQDQFSGASPAQAAGALADLGGVAEEVHVLLTARDLGRQLPSAWQQAVKEGGTDTLEEFWRRADAEGPDGYFWTHQDVPAILDRWSTGLPGDRVHLVVQPRGAVPRSWLWEQVCALTGVDVDGLDAEAERSNESLGVVETEVRRRLQQALPADRRDLGTVRFLKGQFTRRVLASVGPGVRPTTTPAMHRWAVEHATRMSEEVARRSWHVVGDPADLVPGADPPPGRSPDDVEEREVAEVAVRALAAQLLRSQAQREELRALRTQLRAVQRPDGSDAQP